jgi:antitoxin (DNA-binding transcriptional repressor) of toxin-antitoxin stability system
MKYATIAEFRNHLAAYLRRVEKGERILIRRRGEVIAELRPSSGEERTGAESLEQRLEALEREGFLRRGTQQWPEWTRGPITGEAAPLLEALLDERENGR